MNYDTMTNSFQVCHEILFCKMIKSDKIRRKIIIWLYGKSAKFELTINSNLIIIEVTQNVTHNYWENRKYFYFRMTAINLWLKEYVHWTLFKHVVYLHLIVWGIQGIHEFSSTKGTCPSIILEEPGIKSIASTQIVV